jgi:hypothetical protein
MVGSRDGSRVAARVDPPGQHGIHSHFVGQAGCLCMRQAQHPRLGSCVGFTVRLRLQRAGRGVVLARV